MGRLQVALWKCCWINICSLLFYRNQAKKKAIPEKDGFFLIRAFSLEGKSYTKVDPSARGKLREELVLSPIRAKDKLTLVIQ